MKKNLIIIVIGSFFASPVLAQSTVYDVPENKIVPAYENAAATKTQAASSVQKTVVPQPVLNTFDQNTHANPNQQPAFVTTKPIEVITVAPTTPSRVAGTTGTQADMSPVTTLNPVTTKAAVLAPAKKTAVVQ